MILFLIPYVPIPRMVKRIETAACIEDTIVIFWDRGADVVDNLKLPKAIKKYCISEKANEGNPLRRIGATLRFYKKAWGILGEQKPNCIHVTKTDMLLLVWLYYNITHKKDIKVIFEVSDIHSMAMNNSKAPIDVIIKSLLRLTEYVACKVVDSLIVTSPFFWSEYYYKWISEDKVLFIPNTPEEHVFNTYHKKQGGRFRLGFIGKVRYEKQLKMMIDAANKADIDVLIAGNGICLDKIADYCSNMKNVNIYGAYDYKNEIANLYSSIDCVFSMYDTEIQNVKIALPNRLYEAALCELPIIVSAGTELAKIVETEGIGVAVRDGDLIQLTEALIKLKEDYHYRSVLSVNSKRFYEQWRYEKINGRLISLYKQFTKI